MVDAVNPVPNGGEVEKKVLDLSKVPLDELVRAHDENLANRRELARVDAPRMFEIRARVSDFIKKAMAKVAHGVISNFGNFEVEIRKGEGGKDMVVVSGLENPYVGVKRTVDGQERNEYWSLQKVLEAAEYEVRSVGQQLSLTFDIKELDGNVGAEDVDAPVGVVAGIAERTAGVAEAGSAE